MAGAAAGLTIALAVNGRRLQPTLRRSAGPDVAGLLIGKPAAAAPQLLAMIFNLCAAAHGRAAGAAIGAAIVAGERADAARTDILRDHGLAILRDWPLALGGPPDADGLKLLGALLAGKDGAEAALRAHVFGRGFADGRRWLIDGETATARLLAAVRRLSSSGPPVEALPAPSREELAAAAHGAPLPLREMTCGERVWHEPAMQTVTAVDGFGTFSRLFARLTDFSRWLGAPPVEGGAVDTETAVPGVGLALASRGRLAHGAMVDDRGRIADYRVVTPTDWNLAPGGLLQRLLAAIPPGENQGVLVRLAVAASDPCVPATIVWEQENGVTGDA